MHNDILCPDGQGGFGTDLEKGFEMEKVIKGILVICLLAGIVVFTGCKKEEPAVPEVPDAPAVEVDAEAETVSEAAEKAEEKVPDPAEEMAKAMEMISKMSVQTKCPIMGNAINKDIFVTYKDKKVYFCCKPCVAKFEADPESYVSKLPQLGK